MRRYLFATALVETRARLDVRFAIDSKTASTIVVNDTRRPVNMAMGVKVETVPHRP